MGRHTHLWIRVRWLVALVVGATIYGTVGYMALEGWSFSDAAYMTITTLSTVGFGEVRPLDTGGRIFTVTLIMLGVSIVLVTISVVAAWVTDERLGRQRRRRKMEKRAASKRDHYVVCAYGRVGRAVARAFQAEGIPFVVIDRDESLEPRMIDDGVDYLVGDPSEEELLRAAGVDRARGLVVAVDDDATNVFITLMARSIGPELFIVARASEPASPRRLVAAGADRVVSPFVSSGQHMAMMALHPSILDVLEVGAQTSGPMWVEEVPVPEGSPMVGRTLGSAIDGAIALAVRHPDGTVTANPGSDLELRAGDLLLQLGEELAAAPGSQANS